MIVFTVFAVGCSNVQRRGNAPTAWPQLKVSVVSSDLVAMSPPTVLADGGGILVTGTISSKSQWAKYRGHVQIVVRTTRGAVLAEMDTKILPWPRKSYDRRMSNYSARLPGGTVTEDAEIEVSYVDETQTRE